MELRQLRYFLAVADHLNFSKAAKALYITQPALSAQINLLEEELGVALFIRNTKSVALTPAGTEMIFRAKDILREVDNLVYAAVNAKESFTKSGTLNIGIDDCEWTMDYTHIPEQIRHFQDDFPDIKLTIAPFDFTMADKALRDGVIDAAILFSSSSAEQGASIERLNLYADHFSLAVPASENLTGDPDALKRFLAHSTILLFGDTLRYVTQFLSSLAAENIRPYQLLLRHPTTAWSITEIGKGYFFAPTQYLQQRKNKMVDIIPVDYNLDIQLNAYYYSNSKNPALPAFLTYLSSELTVPD